MPARTAWPQAAHSVAEQYLFAAINAERVQQGLAALRWDESMYRAATDHARWMAENRSIAHQYSGEPELAARAQAAGARFSAVLENVGEASTAPELHIAWMNSQPHRENVLDAQVDAVAIGVVQRGGRLYAVEDFAHSVPSLSLAQQESAVSAVLARFAGVTPIPGSEAARMVCRLEHGSAGDPKPWFVMRYTTGDLTVLPAELKVKLRSGQFHQAVVGACAPAESSLFAMYSLAVLLYP